MKRNYFFLLMLIALFLSCSKIKITTSDATNVTCRSAVLSGISKFSSDKGVTVVGIIYSTDNAPTSDNGKILKISSIDKNGCFSITVKDLKSNTDYCYRSFILQNGLYYLGDIKNFTTTKFTPEAIDLGLSVKWASCNMGAQSTSEYGDYYAWGDIEPKKTNKWSKYSYTSFTKYCLDKEYGYNGFTDNLFYLEPEDDVAHVNWGGNWRLPSKSELEELKNQCTWKWTELDGVNGYLVTSNVPGYTDKSIFLPAAGIFTGDQPFMAGNFGEYWSNRLDLVSSDKAMSLIFVIGLDQKVTGSSRNELISVRPVLPKNQGSYY